jgi:hypothetical protein
MNVRNALRATALALPLTVLAATYSQSFAHERHDGDFLQFEFGKYRYPEPAWAAGGISCKGGKKIVRTRGFRDVEPIECDGPLFTYAGLWRGEPFRVVVDSATGRILGVTY